MLFGNSKNGRNLARNSFRTALLGDPRNDENQILSQLHGAFVCLHNIVMSKLEKGYLSKHRALANVRSGALSDMSDHMPNFEAARRICRHHYQYLVATVFLEAFVQKDVIENVKNILASGALPPLVANAEQAFAMPIEFSGAAFRFGHATVRADYDINQQNPSFRIFDEDRDESKVRADVKNNVDFNRLFQFPGEEIPKPANANPIAAMVVSPFYGLPFIKEPFKIGDVTVEVGKGANNLPFRNLLRDRKALHLPSVREVAAKIPVAEFVEIPEPLTKADIQYIPLWFYCLKEAETNGGRLGPVGGTIVATVLLRLLHLDDHSIFASGEDFEPRAELGAEDGKFTMGHLLNFIETNMSEIENPTQLQTT